MGLYTYETHIWQEYSSQEQQWAVGEWIERMSCWWMLMYAVDMLRLVHNKRCVQAGTAAGAAPQCIMLNDRLMTIGRSYKADVKIMLPYISRKHLSVSNHLTTFAWLQQQQHSIKLMASFQDSLTCCVNVKPFWNLFCCSKRWRWFDWSLTWISRHN